MTLTIWASLAWSLQVLRHVYGHPNIISLSNVAAPHNVANLNELYLVIRSFDDESSAIDLSKYAPLQPLPT